MNALAQVYELQQKELARIAAAKQAAQAQYQREVAAFQNSGFPDIFRQFADIPLRKEVRERLHAENTFKSLAWSHQNPANCPQMKDITLRSIDGRNGPRWWCGTGDFGRVRYHHQSGKNHTGTESFDTPDGVWLKTFIEYIAEACDPAAVADVMQKPREPADPQTPQRRKLIAT